MTENKTVLFQADGTPSQPTNKGMPGPARVLLTLMLVFCSFIGGYVTRDASAGKEMSRLQADLKQGRSTPSFPANVAYIGSYTPSGADILEQQRRIREQEAHKEAVEREWKHRPRLSPPSDAPPHYVKVGPYQYEVQYTSGAALSLHQGLAETQLEERVILLNPERVRNLRADMVHELLHCARDLGTGGSRFQGVYDPEENLIEGIDSGFLQILQDNPALLEWLTKSEVLP